MADQAESEALLSKSERPASSSRLFPAAGVAFVIGIALVTRGSLQKPAFHDSSALKASSDEPEGLLTFSANNKYTKLHGATGTLYPWVESPVMEPYRESTLEIQGAQDNHRYFWNVSSTRGNASYSYEGVFVTTNFTDVDDLLVSIHEVDNNHELTRSFSGQLTVRYVRRELRNLEPADLEKYMSVAYELWALSNDAGMAKYGDKFRSVDYLATMHNHLAGDRECDHMHDGLGFMTQHAGLTYLFEKALQSVDKSVTVPYWDWSIDVMNDDSKNLTSAAVWDWKIWDSKYFGSAVNSAHTVLLVGSAVLEPRRR